MASTGELVRTVRLDDVALADILDRLDNSAPTAKQEKRASERFEYRVKGCVVHLQQPGDASTRSYLVPTRNLSSDGLSFLHGGFVHIGSKCVMQLITTRGSWQDVTAQVVRCSYVGDGVHEIAIRFDTQVSPEDYCPAALKARVLLAEDDPSNARLATFYLQQLKAEVDHAENGRIAVDLATRNAYDTILMDMDMPVLDGFGAVRELRSAGYTGMIVATTAMTQPEDQQRCLEAGCDKYIPKPFVCDDLADLLKLGTQEPLYSSFQNDRAMVELIGAFVAELPQKLRAIESAFAGREMEKVKALARAFKGEAGGYGFEPITEAAAKLETSLIDNAPETEVRGYLDELAQRCLAARASAPPS